jgi:TonB family protein
MNRLQKKCVIITVGVHLLLLVILMVGPAFFSPRPKADDLQVLDVIPAILIDASYSSGVANAAPPPPAPVAPPLPPPPVPVVVPPPEPPKVEKVEPVKSPEKLSPPDKPAKTEPRKVLINPKLVTRPAPKNSSAAAAAQQQRQAQAIRTALRNLNTKLTSATTVDLPGNSSVAYANYATAVKSVYELAWILPGDVSDNANTKVSVTIASDGTVISARIVSASDDAGLNASVQRTLERVRFIAPFPEGATEKERTYTINFNPQVKRLLE